MTVKTESAMLTDLAAGQLRGITSEKMRDVVDSLSAVAGVMYTTEEQTQILTTSYQPLTIWTDSKDLKGIQEDLVNGGYTVKAGGLGNYMMIAILNLKLASQTVVEGCTARGGVSGAFRCRGAMGTDESQLIVLGRRNATVADVLLGIELKVDAGPVLATFSRSQFIMWRD